MNQPIISVGLNKVGFQKTKVCLTLLETRFELNEQQKLKKKDLRIKKVSVYGQTTPSMMDFEIIGTLTEDVAINVHFDDFNKSFWFAEGLIEHIDNGQGTVITLDGIDKKWIKGENGDWIEQDTSPIKIELNQLKNRKDWWRFWEK